MSIWHWGNGSCPHEAFLIFVSSISFLFVSILSACPNAWQNNSWEKCWKKEIDRGTTPARFVIVAFKNLSEKVLLRSVLYLTRKNCKKNFVYEPLKTDSPQKVFLARSKKLLMKKLKKKSVRAIPARAWKRFLDGPNPNWLTISRCCCWYKLWSEGRQHSTVESLLASDYATQVWYPAIQTSSKKKLLCHWG